MAESYTYTVSVEYLTLSVRENVILDAMYSAIFGGKRVKLKDTD